MIDGISSALSGIQNASQKVEGAARNIANVGASENGSDGLIQDIVDIKVGEVQFSASAKVLDIMDELAGELLKVLDDDLKR